LRRRDRTRRRRRHRDRPRSRGGARRASCARPVSRASRRHAARREAGRAPVGVRRRGAHPGRARRALRRVRDGARTGARELEARRRRRGMRRRFSGVRRADRRLGAGAGERPRRLPRVRVPRLRAAPRDGGRAGRHAARGRRPTGLLRGHAVSEGPLAGIRIVDLTRLGYGAEATALCGNLGAEILRIESRTRPDPIRLMPPFVPLPGEPPSGEAGLTAATVRDKGFNRGGIFYKYNTGGKRSVALNLKDPRGMDILRRLVATADVLTESFSAGALERMGLPYDELRRIKPDIIYVSMSGFGHRGRDAAHVTLGPTAQALTGLTYLVGLPGRRPAGWSFSYLDHMGGYLGAYAILTALHHRHRTGEGQHVDVSQIEPGIPL